jgi:hypothetical protein
MKKIAFWPGVLLASMCYLPAQVTVQVTLNQDQFLPGESIAAAVRITNLSGQTLHLGAGPDWLTFSIESADGFIVVKNGDVPVVGEFDLESSKRAIKRVDLAPYFRLPKPGRYNIIATVSIKEWNRQIMSDAKPFDIITGSKLWEQVVGIPKKPGATDLTPELRKYTLHQANYLRKQLMLYVQITDANGKIYRVFPIGPMLSFGQPEPEVDKFSNLHVLYQDGPRSFNYTVVSPDGVVLVRQSYDYTTRPKLKEDSDGNLKVVGGARRIRSSDVPPPKTDSDEAQLPPP